MKTRLPNPAKALADRRVRTLVVDDSPLLLKILSQILEEAGAFELVGTATDGHQALRQAAALSPELVLMDLHLPQLNGIQATRHLKQHEPPPVVILVTSDESALARSLAAQAGADAFVLKAGNLRHRLMSALRDLFGPEGVRRARPSAFSLQTAPAGEALPEHST